MGKPKLHHDQESTNHINQLAQWWENADQVAPMRGDLVIENVSDEDGQDYRVRNWPGDRKEKLSYVRVLEPKPKPAWHDAKAVIAITDYCERQVWERDTTHEDRWYGTAGEEAVTVTSDLRDVTPLIEAKVTDEMIQRARKVWTEHYANPGPASGFVAEVLTASFGVELE